MTKKKENPQKAGRKTAYQEEYCDKMMTFFDVPHIVQVQRERVLKDGEIVTYEVERPNSLPTFEKFAVTLGVCVATLHNWKAEFPEFLEAYSKCQQLQKDMLINLGTLGLYNAAFTQFVAKNITDMKDKQEIDQTISGGNLQVSINRKPV